jgi:hypothetical protein
MTRHMITIEGLGANGTTRALFGLHLALAKH